MRFWIALACIACLTPTCTFACSPDELKTNMDWVKKNNDAASAAIALACKDLAKQPDNILPVGDIVHWFTDAELHNEPASQTISTCPSAVIVQAACAQ